ncbi:Uncharacterised protein [Mycobacteroides abscessus subsp. massiliense]|uniref:hypothetical protein n=1 Tax=Mycobacteroides abscessus TaxID=36809 RepID=UPI0009A6E9C7|nr:hypothetical protein [Mycobacteroides abscessus]SKE70478.1 Uncharacterised protein [Mycobacteroides abscessus subsp. massiliense]SKH80706.1 Uncharacterised protein [Mycobacteroides abscessus subsp. massiliense]SKI34298.1 Uncharacterised protein [Mycobacteroides abscessus subsp. massiliense]SKJ36579.1 Uncharacterised protein [Mycobacteroides abscessus subsp. massiliense]SKK23421.1 Uncharacterised protein [Mycobacteroides abscessus subsp. massiliense]
MTTDSVRAAAESAFRAAHPEDRTGALIAGCRAAARVAHPDHAVAFPIGSLADEEGTRASEIDAWLNQNWAQIAP